MSERQQTDTVNGEQPNHEDLDPSAASALLSKFASMLGEPFLTELGFHQIYPQLFGLTREG